MDDPSIDQTVQLERFVSADEAARFVSVTRRELLAMARRGIHGAYPLDPTRTRKTWVFLLSELAAAIKSGVEDPKSKPP
jgi:fructose/tagatose bisphosphate aldolase